MLLGPYGFLDFGLTVLCLCLGPVEVFIYSYPTFNTHALLRNLHPQHQPFYNGPLCGFVDIVIVFFKNMLQNCLMQGDTEN